MFRQDRHAGFALDLPAAVGLQPRRIRRVDLIVTDDAGLHGLGFLLDNLVSDVDGER